MFAYVITDEKLKDPIFLQIVKDGMTNGWSKEKMKEMGVTSPQKHAYFRVLKSGGFLLYGARNEIILHTSKEKFEESHSEVMRYMQAAHRRLCTTWVNSHILTLQKKLDKEVDTFLGDRGKSKSSVNSATLGALYNRIELTNIRPDDYALLKSTKTDKVSRLSVVKGLGLLEKPNLSNVREEAKMRILALLGEL